MSSADRALRLSASHLAGHLACRHLTGLELAVRRGELEAPRWRDPALELLRWRGLEHEKAYVRHLRAQKLSVVDLAGVDGAANHERVLEAARAGADVIVQANLRDERFHGYADVLRRIDEPSGGLGWSYEVVDTKLAQETRGGTVLQLCLYADLMRGVQGEPARGMRVVKPDGGGGFAEEPFRFDDYHAYYRHVRARLEAFAADRDGAEVYPEPVEHCESCRWWSRCDARRHADDHLSLVAGMTRVHAGEIARQGATTLTAFAEAAAALPGRPKRGQMATYVRLQGQASVQLRGRRSDAPVVELLPHEPGRGLARLPEPSPGDVFLDFEGDPFVGDGGLEYLTGYAYVEGRETRYAAIWALERADERRAFERLVDFLLERLRRFPGMHVYHYAPYEPAAMRRLAMRHATREAELDVLLRGERFVDLHAVTRQGVRASVESYSLKPLEEVFGYEREVDLRAEASPALRRVACALEQGLPDEVRRDDKSAVEGYNRDDCLSLIALQRWLEARRDELRATGVALARPAHGDGAASDGIEQRDAAVAEVFDRLVCGFPDEPSERTERQAARWLLAHLLDYFRREEKVAWWEYFARRDAEVDELRDDRKALVELELLEDLGRQGRDRNPVHRYRFPPQEVSLREGDDLYDAQADGSDGPQRIGTVHAIDTGAGIVDVKKSKAGTGRHPRHVHVLEHVTAAPLDGALLELGRFVAQHGVDADRTELRAGRDLILRRPPRTRTPRERFAAPADGDTLATAIELARDLDGGVLAVQGPPGAGKTHTGARMILALANEGRRVGISATSHAVIRNLLEKVLEAATKEGVELRVAHKTSSRRAPSDEPLPDGLDEIGGTGGDQALAALDSGRVVGGVAWLWAHGDCAGALDYLFVDEAGQMSLAHVLACARSARNLVLLGDPQQLQQPQRGAHPEGAEISALNHLLGGRPTMPPELGLFLPETHRLPPAICRYTSEVSYEGLLRSRPGCERQELVGPTPFAGAGLFLVHAEHAGNQSVAREEVELVRRAVDSLLGRGVRWVDGDGERHDLGPGDLLVIAPYNAQVAALAQALPGLKVGTVDRFQGQQAPVVLYSMTSSTAADAPRGLSFLYDPHRLNVATSRARCACILVGTQALFEPECRTPAQMGWANGVCRYRELARVVELSA